jgi:predicted nucleic acid-binding protein
MSDNYFIDTNILVYYYTDDEPVKKQKALEVVANSLFRRYAGWTNNRK